MIQYVANCLLFAMASLLLVISCLIKANGQVVLTEPNGYILWSEIGLTSAIVGLALKLIVKNYGD